VRELLEETGINLGMEGDGWKISKDFEKVGFSEDFFGDKQYTTLYFVVKNIDRSKIKVKNMELDKCEGWEWVHIDDLPKDMFCDSYNQIRSLF